MIRCSPKSSKVIPCGPEVTAALTAAIHRSGHPAAGLVYKLVARETDSGEMLPVQKTSRGKANPGGEKRAIRRLEDGVAIEEHVQTSAAPSVTGRDLLIDYVVNGERVDHGGNPLEQAPAHHQSVLQEMPVTAFRLSPGEPAIPTVIDQSS